MALVVSLVSICREGSLEGLDKVRAFVTIAEQTAKRIAENLCWRSRIQHGVGSKQ